MADRIQLRRDVAADWTSVDPILAEGELGLELDTDKIKMGDGTSVWSALPYASGGSGGSALEVLDEGVSIGAAVESIDFVGAGVTATNVGNDVTVTIAGGGGSGDVVGPASATDNAIARYDTATGKLIQDSSATIDDSGNLSVTGTVDGRDVAADGTALDAHVALTNEHIDWTVDQGATNIHAGNYTDTDTTYVSSDFVHDDLTGFVANEHIDWTVDQGATNIHAGNYTDTTYVSSDFTHDSLTGVDADEHIDWSLTNAKNIHSDNYTDTNTTYVSSDFTHDSLTGVAANEHIDWTVDQGATNIHSGNYTDTDTVVEVLDEGVSQTAAVTSIDFTGTGVVASNVGTDVTVTIDAGTSVTSLNAADPLTGAELFPIVQTGTGVKATLLEVAGTPVQKAVGFDGNSFGMSSMLMNVADGFSATDGDLYGIEPLVCRIVSTGVIAKSTQTGFNYGCAKMSTGTNVAGYSAIRTAAGSFLFIEGTSYMDMGFSGMHNGANSATQQYNVRYGWQRGLASGTYDQGIYIEHRYGDANYIAVVKGTGAATEVDTGIPATQWANAFSVMPTFRIIYDGPGTGDATFYIDGVLKATISTASHTINSLADVGVQIQKTLGTSNRHVFVDSITLDAVLDTRMGDFL